MEQVTAWGKLYVSALNKNRLCQDCQAASKYCGSWVRTKAWSYFSRCSSSTQEACPPNDSSKRSHRIELFVVSAFFADLMKSNSQTWRHTTWSRSAASKISSHSSSRTPSTWPPALGGVSSTGSRIGWRTWKDRLTAGHDELLFCWSCSLVICDLVAHKNKRFLVIQLQLRHFFKAFFVVLIFAPQLSCDLWWCLFFIDRFCKGSSLTRSWSAVKWVTEQLFTMTECNEWCVNQTDVDISGDPVDGIRWWCSYWKRLPETEGHHQAGISQPFYVVRLFY